MNRDVWLPLATLVLGYGGSLLTEALRDRRQERRELRIRRAERLETRADRRDDFQRETLLRLQEPMAKLARATGYRHNQDKLALRRGEPWGTHIIEDESDESYRSATVEINALIVRVSDEELRGLVDAFQAHTVTAAISRSEANADRAVEEM